MSFGNILKTFSVAPHRMFFAFGVILFIIPMLWWSQYLYLKFFGVVYSTEQYPSQAHFIIMLYGGLTQFILGFALTVFPRWLNTNEISKFHYQLIFVLFAVGFLLYFIGIFYLNTLALVGILFVSIGFFTTCVILLKVIIVSNHKGPYQAWITLGAFFSGAIGIFFYMIFLILGDFIFYKISYGLGVFLYLPLLVYSIIYRMLPFFTSTVVQNYQVKRIFPLLILWAFFCVLKAIFYIFDLYQWYILSDLGLLICCLIQFYQWEFFRAKKVWLLKYLYFSVAWFPVSFILYIITSINYIYSGELNRYLELASLHALVVGCFSSLIFSMATRVSLGHSGRGLMTGKFENTLFLLIQITGISRIIFELLGFLGTGYERYVFLSGVLWLVCFIFWAMKYLPIYFSPRIDGRPG